MKVSAAARRPPPGGAAEVAPGVLWLRMPLPYALDHVNLWLLEEQDGWTVVDTGHGDAATRAAWESLAGPVLRGRPILRAICTHHHPDHLGLAGWMAERWGTELWCTRAEWREGRALTRETLREAKALARPFYLRAGIPAGELGPVLEVTRSYRDNVSAVPPLARRLEEGDELTAGGLRWRVIVGRGHSPEHACLHAREAGLFISGDQVLPHITPNVSVFQRYPEADPLTGFLATTDTLRVVQGDPLVLPSHGAPFVGLRSRCEELARHHRARLEAVLAALDGPRTAYEVMGVLFERALDPHQTTFAIGEALAHLHRLIGLGQVRLERRAGEPDRYRRVGAGQRPGVGG